MPHLLFKKSRDGLYTLMVAAIIVCTFDASRGHARAVCDPDAVMIHSQEELDNAFGGQASLSKLRRSVCVAQSNIAIDCRGRVVDPYLIPVIQPAGWQNVGACIVIPPNVESVTISNCKAMNCSNGVLVETRPPPEDMKLLALNYWNREDVTPLEDGIRAGQPKHIVIDHLETIQVQTGLFVLKYASHVSLSWSRISSSGAGVYLDTGTQYNVIRDSTFSTPHSSREAIAVDASAYNQILRNRFEGGWAAGIRLYKNCGEKWWSPPRPQPAMSNRIKYNTFVGLPVGVHIASRADDLYDNWAKGETAQTAAPERWKCADPVYDLPPNPGPPTILRDVTPFDYRVDAVYRQAYYRDRAPDNAVRCNSFSNTASAVVVMDDHALVEGNRSSDNLTIRVGSRTRANKSEPVVGVHVMNNGPSALSCPYGGCVTNRINANLDWGEPEGCNECSAGQSTCPTGFTYGTPRTLPIGWLDSAASNQVCGWAVDLDHPTDSIYVHVYVDGLLMSAGPTNLQRGDVNKAYNITGNHGFCIPVNITGTGNHRVDAYGIDLDGVGNPGLKGGRDVTVTVAAERGVAFINQADPLVQKSWRPASPHVSSGKCLDVVGSAVTNGSQVQLWDCSGNENQRFHFSQAGELVGAESNLCLEAASWGTNGSSVQLSACNGSLKQRWQFDHENALVLAGTSKCLDVIGYGTSNGARLQLWDCTGDGNQAWMRGSSLIRGQQSGRCLDVVGFGQGPGVQLWDCNSAGAHQRWRLTQNYNLVSDANGKCLYTRDSVTSNGTPLEVGSCTSSKRLSWWDDGRLEFTPNIGCVDAVGGGTGNGTRLQLWTCNGFPQQYWRGR